MTQSFPFDFEILTHCSVDGMDNAITHNQNRNQFLQYFWVIQRI